MILITGASSGFGEACARRFAREGKDLILMARRRERLERLAEELQREHRVRCELVTLDVRDRKAVFDWAQDSPKLLSEISLLVNNAGLARGLSTLQEGSPDDWDEMIDTNVKGLLYMTRAVLPALIERAKAGKRSHVINMGSVAGQWTYPKGNVYGASKFAVHALSEGMRLDLSGTGVRVTEIAPGMAETEFSEVRLRDTEKAKGVYSGMTPLSAEDVAEAVYWAYAQPAHVNIQEIVLYPTDQAAPTVVNRK